MWSLIVNIHHCLRSPINFIYELQPYFLCLKRTSYTLDLVFLLMGCTSSSVSSLVLLSSTFWYGIFQIKVTKQSSFYNMIGRSMATAYSYYHNKHLYGHVKCTCELHGLCLSQLFITLLATTQLTLVFLHMMQIKRAIKLTAYGYPYTYRYFSKIPLVTFWNVVHTEIRSSPGLLCSIFTYYAFEQCS